jgi:AraC-like DNA-binding protein
MWSIKGNGKIFIGGKTQDFAEGQIAILLPGSRHFYYSTENSWELRAATIDGVAMPSILQGFGFITSKPFTASACPENRLDKIADNLKNGTQKNHVENSRLIYEILLEISSSSEKDTKKKDKEISKILKTMEENVSDNRIGIEQIASMCGITRFKLSRLLTQHLGISAVKYMQELRLQIIINLLTETNLTISEISKRSGFASSKGMSRFFKKCTGMLPVEFRKNIS